MNKTENEIRIDKNVPIPAEARGKVGKWRPLLMKMEVGDSFEFPTEKLSSVTASSRVLRTGTGRVKGTNLKFTFRRNVLDKTKTRIWRVS